MTNDTIPMTNLSELIDDVLMEVTGDEGLCSSCSPEERASLTAPAHYAVVNLTSMQGSGKPLGSLRQRRKRIRRQTMDDLRCGGFITPLTWLLRPLFMWALRVMIDRLVDRFFPSK